MPIKYLYWAGLVLDIPIGVAIGNIGSGLALGLPIGLVLEIVTGRKKD